MTKANFQLQQMVHGYRRGHELLSASIDLEPKDADRLNQLSDMSGLPVSDSIPAYITCYPLPSGRYYAIAKTWPDHEAAREGCVMTHTILVPMATWAEGYPADFVFGLLSSPQRSALDLARKPIEVPRCPELHRSLPLCSREDMETFALSFFGFGRSPIVWLDGTGQVESIIPALLDFIWPSLRSSFAACSFALQQRSTHLRPFDLLIAPPAAISRFSRFSKDQIIGYGSGRPTPTMDPKHRRLVDRVTHSLLEGDDYWPAYKSLRATLPPEPSALSKVTMLDELQLRAQSVPSASVAVLDVLAALAPDPDEAISEKRHALQDAVDRAEREDPLQAMELMTAIASRCVKPAFRSFRLFRKTIVDRIAHHVRSNPNEGLSLLARSKFRRSYLLAAVARGLMTSSNAAAFAGLRAFGQERPTYLRSLIRLEPRLVAAYLHTQGDSVYETKRASDDILAWYEEATGSTRRAIAKSLFQSPVIGRIPNVLAVTLEHASAFDVSPILNSLSLDGTAEEVWIEAEELARRFPEETRQHLLTNPVDNERAGALLASLLDDDPLDFEVLEPLYKMDQGAALWTLLALTDRSSGIGDRPSEIESRWIGRVLKHSGAHPALPRVGRQLLRHFTGLDILDAADPRRDFGPLWNELGHELGLPMWRSASFKFVSGEISTSDFQEILKVELIRDSARLDDVDKLLRMMLERTSSSAARTDRLWKWLLEVIDLISDWHGDLVTRLLRSVFDATAANWSDDASRDWCGLLNNYRRRTAPYVSDALAAQSLQIALSNPQVRLFAIVDWTFPDVYISTVSRSVPTLLEIWFSSNWDKGKELRKKLLSCFTKSDWPPENFLIVSSRAGILEKMVSRAKRHGHTSYVKGAVAELTGSNYAEYRTIGARAQEILKNSRSEDWD
jgi:hypothetical protein